MTSADISRSRWPQTVARRFLDAARKLRPPVRSRQFWLVQAGVLFVAFLDLFVLDHMGFRLPFGIPNAMITAMLLIPVVYGAVIFGVVGAVRTGRWATTLLIFDSFSLAHG